MKTVIILKGLPGQGKSTIAQLLNNSADGIVCSADDYHVDLDGVYKWKAENVAKAHDYCKRRFRDALTDTNLIIVDNTNTTEKEYGWYVEKAKEHGYWPVLVTVGMAGEEDIANSIMHNTHNVPEETIVKMAKRFEFKKVK